MRDSRQMNALESIDSDYVSTCFLKDGT